jgi:hypothetical protein
MTLARIGHGSTFKIGNSASPEVFTAVAEVLSISGPAIARDAVDATSFDSVEAWREFIPGLKDGGEISLQMLWLAAEAEKFEAEFAKTKATNYQVTFPFSPVKTWAFKAICTGFEQESAVEATITATATFKISGKPTLT